jgi:hypothetical protein
LADECICEPRALRGEAINIGRFDQGVAVASERAGGLVVGKKEDEVGLLGRLGQACEQEAKGGEELFHFVKRRSCLASLMSKVNGRLQGDKV